MKSDWRQKLDGLQTRVQSSGFQWVGRSREGVNMWRGGRNGPPRLLIRILRIYGACIGVFGVGAAAVIQFLPPRSAPELHVLMTVGLIHAIVFSALSYWLDSVCKSLAHLKSAAELAQQMGLDAETIRRIAAEKAIKPRLNLNKDDLYDPDRFIDAVSLLRGASAPVSPDTLVRPALPTTASAPETLLRATVPTTDSGARQYSTADERVTNQVESRQG